MLDRYVARDVRFIDPFHNTVGIEPMRQGLQNLFVYADQPKIRISDRAWGRDGHTVYLRWSVMRTTAHNIEGVSEISFGRDGLVASQTNHWDSGSQIIARHPLTRWIWNRFVSRMTG